MPAAQINQLGPLPVLDLLHKLSLESGAVVVLMLSAALTLGFSFIERRPLRLVLSLAAPSAVAYCLFWLPVWLGASASEYSSWAGILIVPWAAVGTIASVFVVVVVGTLRRAHQRDRPQLKKNGGTEQ